MDRARGIEVEEAAAISLPLCVRRLRGPGRARRLPPGSAYRSAGSVLRRALLYSADGQAHVQVVRSDGLSTPKERPEVHLSSNPPAPLVNAASAASLVAAAPSATASTAPSTTMGMSNLSGVSNAGLMAEVGEESTNASRSTHMSGQNADEVQMVIQQRRERASALAAETARRYEEEQKSTLADLLQALPLLHVVPPLCLQQQAYTREAPPASTANRAATPDSASNNERSAADVGAPASSRFPVSTSTNGGNSATGHGLFMALRAAQARYSAVQRAVVHDRRGLDLRSAVVLSKEETKYFAPPDSPHERRNPSATTVVGPSTASNPSPSADASAAQLRQPPLPPSLLPEAPLPLRDAAFLFPTTAAAADTTDSALNGAFIDGGLGVTIKLGSSCDDPNSLRCGAWGGCRPVMLRAVVWRLLTDYAPAQVARQHAELQRKRRQYERYTHQYCSALTMLAVNEPSTALSPCSSPAQRSEPASTDRSPSSSVLGGASGSAARGNSATLSRLPVTPYLSNFSSKNSAFCSPSGGMCGTSSNSGNHVNPAVSSLSPHERAIMHQMLLDLPRHQSPVFHARRSVAGMARCLFLWSQRHPAVGYVQGMDDVVATVYQVFLTDALRQHARARLAGGCRSPSLSQTAALPTSAPSSGGPADLGVSGDDSASDEGIQGGSDHGTRDIMRLLLVSLNPHPPAASASAPLTPNAAAASATTAGAGGTSVLLPEVLSTPASTAGASGSAASLSPFLVEADLAVCFPTPAALDAALADLPDAFLTQVEADTFFCAGRILSFLQDNFTSGQPGILRSARRLESLVRVVDPAVVTLLDGYGLTVMDGCFQWLHCLLARELPLSLLLRLWDCYLTIGVGGDQPVSLNRSPGMPISVGCSSGGGNGGGADPTSSSDDAIMHFHVCVCCALLRMLRASLMGGPAASPYAPLPAATASSSPSTPVGGWTAALATALPGFRPRTSQSSGEGAAACAKLPIDAVMAILKRPFETLFPRYPSIPAKRQQLDADRQKQLRQGGTPSHGSTEGQSSTPEESTGAVVAAAERWLDLLIADAYCIWRLYGLSP
ncbi:hypothetical protein ABL78_4390 [Leptomonas seymouri]|uniref:Rab-GAP TBC domain-containing protein n=1 Tax=Leptomonas seymouri TaxID=5684 RepID=A0A0N1PE32_LEPSE|nr:hypothetical protein ABL78_4390 [Leptomonas seymouri]|eukprot:KPI86525.1 hypothetical protein ABL78_4390 [Leptomonas seymouri]